MTLQDDIMIAMLKSQIAVKNAGLEALKVGGYSMTYQIAQLSAEIKELETQLETLESFS